MNCETNDGMVSVSLLLKVTCVSLLRSTSLLLLLLLVPLSCGSDNSATDSSSNPTEVVDGDAKSEPREEPGICGDGKVGPGEVCEGSELPCWEFGYATGTALCSADCKQVDLSACCGSPCGNGVVDEGEECDRDEKSCEELGGGLGSAPCLKDCSGYLEEACHETPGTCGDNIRQAGELCDGTPAACAGLGYLSGVAWCDATCLRYDTSTCCGDAISLCGDGVVDKDHEACDGGEAPCDQLGFVTGTAACLDDCSGYDMSSCCGGGGCGNGMLDPGEVCDDQDLHYCSEFGLGEGIAICLPDCTGFILQYCVGAPPVKGCGDKVLDEGEICDSGNMSCVELGYESGWTQCKDDCTGYDVDKCGGCSPQEMGAACNGIECGEGDCDTHCGSCPVGQKCMSGDCVSCGNCTVPDAMRCGADNYTERCMEAKTDCYEWVSWAYCGGKACVDGYCVPKDPCYPGAEEEVECDTCMKNTYTCGSGGTWSNTGCKAFGCNPEDKRCSADGSNVEVCNNDCEWKVSLPCEGTEFCWSVLLSDTGEKIGEGQCQYPHECADEGSMKVTCQGQYCEYHGGWGDFVCHPYEKTEPCKRSTEGNGCGQAMKCKSGTCVEECPGGHICDYFACVPADKVCDGKVDCENRSDEKGCGGCDEQLYGCADGSCQQYWEYCVNPPGFTQFHCAGGGPMDKCKLCDGNDDCGDGEDEFAAYCLPPYTSIQP